MDEENNNNQQSDLDNNPVSQMEARIADKTAQQVKNIANNVTRQVKKMVMKAVKAAAKAIAKIVAKIAANIIRIIVFTFPINLIVAVIIITIIIVAFFMETFSGFANIFKNDMQTGNVTTSEVGSIYDQSAMPTGGDFTITATDDVAEIANEIHNVMATSGYWYRNGNIMNYPELLVAQRT